jgi:hypothetical protein
MVWESRTKQKRAGRGHWRRTGKEDAKRSKRESPLARNFSPSTRLTSAPLSSKNSTTARWLPCTAAVRAVEHDAKPTAVSASAPTSAGASASAVAVDVSAADVTPAGSASLPSPPSLPVTSPSAGGGQPRPLIFAPAERADTHPATFPTLDAATSCRLQSATSSHCIA